MAIKKEVNVERFLNRVRSNITSTLYDWDMVTIPGLNLEDALVPFGEPVENGEKELDALIEDLVLQVEIAINKPPRKKSNKPKRIKNKK